MQEYMVKWLGEDTSKQIVEFALNVLPTLLSAIAVLVLGWLAARFIAWLVYKALCKTTLDDWLVEKMGLEDWLKEKARKSGATENLIERSLSKLVYWTMLVGVAIATFEILDIKMISEPLSAMLKEVTTSVDDLLKAGLIMVAAIICAFAARLALTKALKKLKFDERTKKYAPEDAKTSISKTVGNIAFYGILFFALAPFLDALKLTTLADPVRDVLTKIMAVLPKAGGALIVFGIGYIVSKIVREIVSNLLLSVGLDRGISNLGLDKLVKDQSPSRLIGATIQVVILVQLVISGLENLGLTALSGPLTSMLGILWSYVPKVLGGALLVILGVVAGRALGRFAAKALESIGFDKFLRNVGLGALEDGLSKAFTSVKTPSALGGYVVSYVIILLMIGQVVDTLQLEEFSKLIHTFLSTYLLRSFFAMLIIGVGFIVGSVVQRLVAAHGTDGTRAFYFLGTMARYLILVFAFTMAASHVGLGHNIVMIAFFVTFGAFCLALALAFGLGGREVAAQITREQFAKVKQSGALDDVARSIGESMEKAGEAAAKAPAPKPEVPAPETEAPAKA